MTDYARHYRNLTIGAFFAGLFVFGYMIVSPAFHIDTELAKVGGFNDMNVMLGRWGTTLLHRTVLPAPFVPFFTELFSVALLALAAVAAASCLELSGRQSTYFVLLYMAFPQFAYQMEFPFQSDCIAFGLFIATCSFAALMRAGACGARVRWTAASVALLVVSTSFYQSLLFVPLSLVMVHALNRLLDCRVSWQRLLVGVAAVAALTAVSATIYSSLTRVVQHVVGIPRAPWLDGMIGWTQTRWQDCLSNAVSGIARKILGKDYYGNGLYATTLLATAAIIVRCYFKRFSLKDAGTIVLVSAASIAMPFILNIPFGADMPARTFLSAPIAFAGIWAIAMKSMPQRLGLLPAFVVAAALISGSYHVSSLATADAMAFEADKLLGNRIVSAIYTTDPDFNSDTTPVYFLHGFTPINLWRQQDSDVFGASFFAWDGGNPDRIIAFLKAVGIANLRRARPAQVASVTQAAAALPAWPNPNSVRLVNGILVVKLGQN
jgi:hypothetical protein